MVDLILIDPPADASLRFGRLAKAGSRLPSLGLGYLASVARDGGYSVKIINGNLGFEKLSDLGEAIVSENPKWVGITATTLTIDTVAKIAQIVKEKLPNVLVIVGGAHMTAVPKEVLKRYRQIDIGVIGEGEETFADLLFALERGKTLAKIPGIIYRKSGKIILNPPRRFLMELDKLSYPAWDLIAGFPDRYTPSVNSYLKLPAAHLFTSRGCTGKCLFCDRSVFGRFPRMHSAKYVLNQIEFLVKNYGIREIQFFDDNFCLFPQRLKEICQMLIKKKWGISWSCQARADMINEKMLKLMKKAGCWQIGLGLESGSDKILKILQKGETKATLRRAVEITAKAGIEVKGFFILGNPGETKKTLEETEDFILSLPLTYVHTTYFTPYPGSQSYQRAGRFGQFKDKNNWSKIGQGTIEPIFIPRGLSSDYLKKTAARVFKRFYFRPKIILYHLKKVAFLPQLWLAYLKGVRSVFAFSRR